MTEEGSGRSWLPFVLVALVSIAAGVGGTALFLRTRRPAPPEPPSPSAKAGAASEHAGMPGMEAAPEGDVFFPPFDERDWREIESVRHPAGEKDDHAFTLRVLERRFGLNRSHDCH